jgi:hypothetical protein
MNEKPKDLFWLIFIFRPRFVISLENYLLGGQLYSDRKRKLREAKVEDCDLEKV